MKFKTKNFVKKSKTQQEINIIKILHKKKIFLAAETQK